MDRERVIALAGSEIRRREALASLGGWNAKDHREIAEALRELLEAYTAPIIVPIPPFRAHNIRPADREVSRR